MLLIFTGLHGPVPRGQSLAGIGLTEAGEQQDPQNITGPQDRAPPLNLGDLLPKTVPGVSSNKNKGVLIGAGFPPIPASLAERILKWEYIEMAELVPYIWSLPWSTGQPSKPCRQVRDIAVWMQCFACYTAVLSTRFPETPRISLPTWLQFWVPPRSLRVRGLLTTQRTGSRWQYLATETGPRPMALCSQSASQPDQGPFFVASCASAHCI